MPRRSSAWCPPASGWRVTSAVSVQDEVRPWQARRPFPSPPLHRRLGIIRRRDKPISPALQAVLGVLTPTRRTTA